MTREPKCDECGGTMSRSNYCGVWVCDSDACGYHRGLVRCYCGWSLSGGDGVEELLEEGEVLDDDY